MSGRVEVALERLGQAVARLESVGQYRLQAMAAAGGDEADVARLSAELDAVRTDYQDLQLTSQQASGRIDAAIGRLRALLDA